MDQLSPIYDNPLSETLYSAEPVQQGLSDRDSHEVMQTLSANLDLHRLASDYYTLLKRYLNVDAISIQFPAGKLSLGEDTGTISRKTLESSHQHHVFATLVYAFNKVLTIREQTMLTQLHRLFKFPLKNALEFYNVKQLAMKDHLTSLGNRASYHETLHRLISQAKRDQQTFGILVIDMDRFKQVNDTFGHHEGDKVLMATAEVLRQSLRDTDFAFRFGGDEFCCLLPGSEPATNEKIAQRIHSSLRSHSLLSRHRVSGSIGSAHYLEGDDEQSLFDRADKALYEAKQSGRNCIKAA